MILLFALALSSCWDSFIGNKENGQRGTEEKAAPVIRDSIKRDSMPSKLRMPKERIPNTKKHKDTLKPSVALYQSSKKRAYSN